VSTIEVSDALAAKLDVYPSPCRALERAINRMLDAERWPVFAVDAIGVVREAARYVVVFERWAGGWMLRGHVGPIADEKTAHRVCSAWRSKTCRPLIRTVPLGPCMTNSAGGAYP
jgi:hypothetical protein